MKNIYDIRKEYNLNYIVNKEKKEGENSSLGSTPSVCVAVNLYYIQNIEWYINYLNRIPDNIHLYICSSKAEVLEKSKELLNRKNATYHLKENRGRDISALLVALCPEILKYDYFCFIHDKTANQEYLREDAEIWVKNLWDNILANEKYICDIIKLFENNTKLGVLAPPEPLGEFYAHYHDNTWNDNYDNAVLLAQRLGIKADIDMSKNVFMLGTVFWARTAALKKLLEYEWQYDDFQDEPLPVDGTLSHAIERILGYVAQDAGYTSGTIMTEEYASWLLLTSQEYMREMFGQLKKREHVFNMHQVINLDERETKIKKLFSDFSKVYIYGAGNYGVNMLKYLQERHMNPMGFVVTNGQKKVDAVESLPVYEIGDIKPDAATAVLIAVSYEYQSDVETTLREHGVDNYLYGY